MFSYPVALRTANRHPTQKPIALIRELTELFSNPGDIILDPFLGSGTTLLAAQHLGRRGLGIEISEEYCATAAKRVEGLLPAVVPEGQATLPLATAEAGAAPEQGRLG